MRVGGRPAGRRGVGDRLSARPPQVSDAWVPALDGLRGLAVLAVLLYHAAPDEVPGGYLGVSLFFTLSGFLITQLLLREHATTGRISLGRFWVRRARRLVPVALVGLGLALLAAWVTHGAPGLASAAADVRFAALNLANWRLLGAGTDYGDALAAPSPVTHYWSLAIEEQFYVVYPVVAALALRAGRQCLGGVLLIAAGASVGAQLIASTDNRAYLGTDTRLAELALGALLAVVVSRRPVRPGRGWDVTGSLALATLALAWATLPLADAPLRAGGLVAHALLACVVVGGALHGRALARLLSVRPLVELGLLSYGIYVVHLPLFLLLTPNRVHLDGPVLLVVRLAASVVAAVAVHLLVERPVRWHGALPGWQGAVGWVTATTAVVLVAIALPHVQRADPLTTGPLAGARTTVITMPDRAPAPPSAPSTTTTTASAPGEAVAPDGGGTAGRAASAAAAPGELAATRALHLLVVGDSTAAATGQGLQVWAEQTREAVVDVVAGPGCTFEQSGVAILRDGWEQAPRPACVDLLRTARRVAGERQPDAVLLLIGSLQLADWRFGAGPTQSLGDLGFEARYLEAAAAGLAVLEGLGAPVLWATLPVPAWDPAQQFGVEPPGSGPLTINDAARTRRLNELNAVLVGAHPLVRLVPYAELLARPDGTISERLRPDGMHLAPDQVPGLMAGGFEAALRAAYLDVLDVRPDLAPPDHVRWSP